MWQNLKSDFTEFVRAAAEEGGTAIATLDKKLNDLDDKLTEVTGGQRNEDDDNDDIDYTGGDANDVLYNNEVGQIESNVSPPDLREISDVAMNVGKTAASFLAEKVGGAATSIRMHQSKGGRPPFVMTAVEDDDDEYVEGEEYSDDDDEEELGWTESEEEEEEEECDSGDDEVDFTNQGQSQPQLPLESLDVVKMRESLKNAEEERNQCMQLVEDRNQEICKLKLALDQWNAHESSSDQEVQCLNDLRREVLWFRKLVAVKRQEEPPSELKSILSEMRGEVSNEQNIADLEMKIQSVKDSLATSYAKIDQLLLVREEMKQTALKERMGGLEENLCALQKEIEENRDQIKLQQQALEEQPAREIVGQIACPRDSPSSSTSSGVLIGKDGIVENY